jgi:hypothetical protein
MFVPDLFFLPLPTFWDIVTALKSPRPIYDESFPVGHHTIWMRMGRQALAEAVKRLTPDGQVPTVWLPEYICREATHNLLAEKIHILFYPVTPQLHPDWRWLQENTTKMAVGQVFTLVHFFGFFGQGQEARQFCNEYGLSLIDDAAHCLPDPDQAVDFHGDALIYSPRKTLPLPDGGQLVLKTPIDGGDSPDGMPVVLSQGAPYLWICKNILRKTLPGLVSFLSKWVGRHELPPLVQAEIPKSVPTIQSSMRSFTYHLLAQHKMRLKIIAMQRRENYLAWAQTLEDDPRFTPLFTELPPLVSPQVFPVFINLNSPFPLEFLRKSGFPISVWPDLPLEIAVQTDAVAVRIRERLVLLPVHQDLTSKDIQRLSSRLLLVIMRDLID